MNGNAVRKTFLEKSAQFLIDEYDTVLRGGKFTGTNGGAREKMWVLLEKIVVASKDTEALKVSTSADVWSLIKAGEVDLDKAIKLMELLQAQQDLVELPKLREALENLKS